MIIVKYIFKEIFKVQIITIVILLTVIITQSIIKFVKSASVGEIPVDLVSHLVMLSLPGMVSILLPLTLFIAILITMSRICSDSEMVVMRSVGFSPTRVLAVTAVLALITGAGAVMCSAYLAPISEVARQNMVENAQNNPRYLPIESEKFLNFNDLTIYLEEVSDKRQNLKELSRIYALSITEGVQSAVVARDGFIETDDDGVQWLSLKDCSRVEGPLADGSFRISHFETLLAPIAKDPSESRKALELSMTPTSDLMGSDDLFVITEFQWRFSPLLASLILPFIAVPLSMVNPRQGRFARLFPAILIYAGYYLSIVALRNLVRSGGFPVIPGLFTVPLVFLLLLVIPLNIPKEYVRIFLIRHHIMPDRALRNAQAMEEAARRQVAMAEPDASPDSAAPAVTPQDPDAGPGEQRHE